MSLFTQKTKITEPAEWAPARKTLAAIGSTAPVFGVKGTAEMTDTEQQAQGLLAQYSGSQSQEVQDALASLKEAGQYTNILDVPEYAALYKSGQGNINNQLNRVGRTLQLSGNTNTTSGAGVMTNAIGDLNTELLGSMAPYAAQERERRYNAPITAANLATNDTQARLSAVKGYGALPRELKQLSLDAQYMADYLNQTAPYTYQVPALSAVGNIGQTVVSGGGMTDLGMAVQIGGSIAGSYLGK